MYSILCTFWTSDSISDFCLNRSWWTSFQNPFNCILGHLPIFLLVVNFICTAKLLYKNSVCACVHLHWVKEVYKGKIKQYIKYGSSGESLQYCRSWLFLRFLWIVEFPPKSLFVSPALMSISIVWAVYAKVDLFREILNTLMQVNIALLMLICVFDVK